MDIYWKGSLMVKVLLMKLFLFLIVAQVMFLPFHLTWANTQCFAHIILGRVWILGFTAFPIMVTLEEKHFS